MSSAPCTAWLAWKSGRVVMSSRPLRCKPDMFTFPGMHNLIQLTLARIRSKKLIGGWKKNCPKTLRQVLLSTDQTFGAEIEIAAPFRVPIPNLGASRLSEISTEIHPKLERATPTRNEKRKPVRQKKDFDRTEKVRIIKSLRIEVSKSFCQAAENRN